MKNFVLLLLFIPFVFSCSSERSTEGSAKEKAASTQKGNLEVEGFESIETMTQSLVSALEKRDYDGYLTHVITRDLEEALASQIEDKRMRKEFLKEFGFSLKNERESFDDMIKYIDQEGISLADAELDRLVVVDYEHSHYAPLILKEVIVPVPKENYEIDLLFTAIQYNGKWFLTSELGV